MPFQPGMPGSLGLPVGSDSSLPSGNDAANPNGVVNRSYFFADSGGGPVPGPHTFDASGSFSIPETTAGNLVVVFITNAGFSALNGIATIGDDAGDVFLQVPWYAASGSNAVAGEMAAPDTGGIDTGDTGIYDAWYAVTQGGATVINWSCADKHRQPVDPEFWVYELQGGSGTWKLLSSGITQGDTSSTVPFVGPFLNGTETYNWYFSIVGSADAFNLGDGVVNYPWALDPSFSKFTYGQSLGLLLNATGINAGAFSSGDSPDAFVICGVAFGWTPATGGGGGPPPPGPLDMYLPNFWITC